MKVGEYTLLSITDNLKLK